MELARENKMEIKAKEDKHQKRERGTNKGEKVNIERPGSEPTQRVESAPNGIRPMIEQRNWCTKFLCLILVSKIAHLCL